MQGSPERPSGLGRLKGNAVKIGNSSRCCKFRHPEIGCICDIDNLQPLVHTGKASISEQVRRPASHDRIP